MGILFFIIIQTESRSGLISFVLILLILLWKLIGNKLFFIVCSILGTLAICVYLGTHTLSFESLAFLSGKTDSTNERLLIYESVGRLVLEHHFLGVGPGVTPLYVFDALYGTVNVPVDVDDTMSAHNFWLSNLADVGFIGICPFLIFFSWMVIKAIKYGVKKGHLLKVVPLCILVAFIASTVASSSIFEMRVVWIGLGIGIAIIQLLQKKEEENICD
nr:O-antigen ligase family protein [Listeria aquatica]